jgi:hypothetical protein
MYICLDFRNFLLFTNRVQGCVAAKKNHNTSLKGTANFGRKENNNKAFSPKQVVVGYLIVCKYRVATRLLPYCMLRHLKNLKLFTYR